MDEISKEIAAHNARSNTYTKKYMAQLKRKLGIESDYALAKALQVSKTTVSNYSNGTTAFSARVCHRVADLLEIHPALVVSAIEIDRHSGAEQKEIDTWTYIHRAMAKAKIAAVNLSVVLACAIVIFATEGALFSNEAVAMSADSGLYIMSNAIALAAALRLAWRLADKTWKRLRDTHVSRHAHATPADHP